MDTGAQYSLAQLRHRGHDQILAQNLQQLHRYTYVSMRCMRDEQVSLEWNECVKFRENRYADASDQAG